MQTFNLSGIWQMRDSQGVSCPARIPGSAYGALLEAGLMEDPYYRDNELKALKLMERDYSFERSFTPAEALLGCRQLLLRCEGLDTLCTLTLNGQVVGRADNMFRTWEFDVTGVLKPGENTLRVDCASPNQFIRKAYEEAPVLGSRQAMRGFPRIRKAHCMFGWDWGPRLPDVGIWRDILLVGVDSSRLEDLYIEQRHEDGEVYVTVHVRQSGNAEVRITLTDPDGAAVTLTNHEETRVEAPRLWWPNGFGEHPLYGVSAELLENGRTVDSQTRRIGLRTMTVVREKDR